MVGISREAKRKPTQLGHLIFEVPSTYYGMWQVVFRQPPCLFSFKRKARRSLCMPGFETPMPLRGGCQIIHPAWELIERRFFRCPVGCAVKIASCWEPGLEPTRKNLIWVTPNTCWGGGGAGGLGNRGPQNPQTACSPSLRLYDRHLASRFSDHILNLVPVFRTRNRGPMYNMFVLVKIMPYGGFSRGVMDLFLFDSQGP